MNASKENAVAARAHLEALNGALAPRARGNFAKRYEFVQEFLEACGAKLPFESSFTAQKNRKRRFNPPLPPKEEE